MSHNQITVNQREPNRTGLMGSTGQIIVYGQGESDNYSNSSATGFAAGNYLYFYDSSPVNTISGSSMNPSNGWINDLDLPAGTYTVDFCFNAKFSSSGHLNYALRVGTSNKAYFGSCGASSAHDRGACVGHCFFDLTGTTTVRFVVFSSSGVDSVANQGTNPSEGSWFIIRKVDKI